MGVVRRSLGGWCLTVKDKHHPTPADGSSRAGDCTKEAAAAAEAIIKDTDAIRRLNERRPSFRGCRHCDGGAAPDAVTAAADLAAVVYYAVDLWGHTMDDTTLALWQEAADVSRRIGADARLVAQDAVQAAVAVDEWRRKRGQ